MDQFVLYRRVGIYRVGNSTVSCRVRQELCESAGGRPGLPVLMSLMVSVDVKQHWTLHTYWSQFSLICQPGHPRTLSSASAISIESSSSTVSSGASQLRRQFCIESDKNVMLFENICVNEEENGEKKMKKWRKKKMKKKRKKKKKK